MSELDANQSKRRPDRAALLVAGVLAAIAALIAWDASKLSGAVSLYSGIGAEAFPYAVAVLLALSALGTAAAALKGSFPEREALEWSPVIWIVAGLISQLLLLRTAGFSLATGLLFAATAKAFGRGPLWLTIPLGVVFAFILYAIFTQGLQLSLPAGPLERLL